MGRKLHSALNKAIPMGVRKGLRESAKAFIPSLRHLDMPARLRHLASMGVAPQVIFDVGAASGEWARLAHTVWPAASIVGFEPNARERKHLERTKAEVPAFDFRVCFLGRERRTVEYHDNGTQTSLVADEARGPLVKSEMLVLDELIASGDVPAPDFLKLDVQGYELEVLRGGESALRHARAALLEVSFVRFAPDLPMIAEVVAFMGERGYEWADVLGILRGPRDDALWQMDALFLKRDDPLRRVVH
jgi:FkbM family methyltransferase